MRVESEMPETSIEIETVEFGVVGRNRDRDRDRDRECDHCSLGALDVENTQVGEFIV